MSTPYRIPADSELADVELPASDTPEGRALNRALTALDAMADEWAERVNLRGMAENIAAAASRPQLLEAIYAVAQQGFVEGAYHHHCAVKDGHCPHPSSGVVASADDLATACRGLLQFIRERYPDDFKEGGRGFICPHHIAIAKALGGLG